MTQSKTHFLGQRHKIKKTGFSLIEIVVTLAVIGVIAAILTPVMNLLPKLELCLTGDAVGANSLL